MNKIGEINNSTESKLKCMLWGITLNIILGISIYMIEPFGIVKYLTLEHFKEILLLPVAVIVTLILHEAIHVIGFKYYGHGEAKVRIKREKKAGAIVVQQLNSNLYYSRNETIVILLSPLLIITIISVPLISIAPYPLIIFLNCILNAIGSSIDTYISLKLLTGYSKDIRIQYNNGNEVGMVLYEPVDEI